MKSFKFFLLVAAVLLMTNTQLLAQPTPFECPDPFEPCPIDGGVSLLIAAGIGLAAKKAHMDRNKRKVLAEENNK